MVEIHTILAPIFFRLRRSRLLRRLGSTCSNEAWIWRSEMKLPNTKKWNIYFFHPKSKVSWQMLKMTLPRLDIGRLVSQNAHLEWSSALSARRSFWLSSERRRPLCPRSWQLSDDWIPVLINGFPPLRVGNYDYMPGKGGTHRWETFHMVDTWYLDILLYVFFCFALVYPCSSIFREVSCLSHFLSNSLIQWMRSWWQISLLRLISNNSEDIQCITVLYYQS